MQKPPETRSPTAGQAAGASGDIEAGSVHKHNGNSVNFQEKGEQSLALDLIKIDPDLQMREGGLDVGVVADYAEAMEGGASFPPIIIFFDGDVYWPADGFHRIAAARKVGLDTIAADVRQGNRRDAILFAVGVNSNHGLRRTQADKRRSVETLLKDPEWSRLSDRAIAEKAKVSHPTVARVRAELTGKISTPPAAKVATADTGKFSTAVETSGQGSMVERMLAKASDEALIAECRRRYLEVSHAD
ncbi:hypothetical protein [Mesorhizobium sangaii]|uniref:ParB/Sulfiredoxin domain-containing protein n=1 Tax=Mesorhizobium sangaii TaxID=505389 RepID=A0A841PGA2_9HYPH|nr:hypothetical protein [Mesorhizobium sangaii]MBB6407645.1 hypothetical protein [Mesorhizobium sangaii]